MSSISHLVDLGIVRQIVDIAIVSYLIYRGLLLIKGTRAAPMLAGLALVIAFYLLSKPLGLTTLGWILGNVLSSIFLIIIVLFQDEIRRGLTKVGMQPGFMRMNKPDASKTADEVSVTADKLAQERLGALIVIQREVGLDEFVEDGVMLDARLDRKLLHSLFVKDSPLHDGAVVIGAGRVKAAGCVLPLSFNPDLDPGLGTRHRAALGLSERSDAVIIVVSEENGAISFVCDGKLIRNITPSDLKETILKNIQHGDAEDDNLMTEEENAGATATEPNA